MRAVKSALALLLCLVLLTACAAAPEPASAPSAPEPTAVSAPEPEIPAETTAAISDPPPEQTAEPEPIQTTQKEESVLQMSVNGSPVEVAWEENESVAALLELAEQAPLTLRLSPYGGFEQVGPIGRSLPRRDVQITTGPGDIVLYAGNQIVLFYGSNTWAYTRLGRIQGLDRDALTRLLDADSVALTLTVGSR